MVYHSKISYESYLSNFSFFFDCFFKILPKINLPIGTSAAITNGDKEISVSSFLFFILNPSFSLIDLKGH